ncbi:MAG: site-specific DNA-methyltransferase [Clostridiales bacterium]|nr:site-specific DNA-methyltransferase [Clostridiales bacterium]
MSSNENTYKGIYAMHKYWGKKPFNEISKFIEKYTKEDEVVLDSFCGSGVTLIEALKANRKCIGVDLNPIAIKLAKVSMTSVNIEDIEEKFREIKKKLQPTINSLYEVEKDGEKTLITHTIWKNNKPIEVWYTDHTKKKQIRCGENIDIKMANNPSLAPKWYPTSDMFENSRINVGEQQKVSDLFMPRALVGLSLLCDEIQGIENEKLRNVFELTLSGTLSQASNLVFVIRRRKKNKEKPPRAEVGSWVIGYWVPEEHFEINVWNCFENRYKRILKGEKEINELFSSFPDNYFEKNVSLFNDSATKLHLEDDSVDYVFIDPPHANRILYMEQSLMWNAWLKLDQGIDWSKEIIVSGAKKRKNKDTNEYNKLLNEAFLEIKRVLKHDKFFSMAFNCLNDDTWINTLNLFVEHGFEICDIVPLEYSATSVIQDNRKNALKTDFVLTFKNSGNSQFEKIVFKEDDESLKKQIKKLIVQYPNYEVYNIMNALFEQTIPKRYIFRVSKIVKMCAEMMD